MCIRDSPNLLQTVIVLATILTIMFYFSAWMGLVIIAGVAIMTALTKLLGSNSAKFFIAQQTELGVVEGHIEEVMNCLLYTSPGNIQSVERSACVGVILLALDGLEGAAVHHGLPARHGKATVHAYDSAPIDGHLGSRAVAVKRI